MIYTLGIDIGTYSSKGVIVDDAGAIIATATTPHDMIVPRPGWAEHRPDVDWWGDLVLLTRKLLATSGIDPTAIRCVATSAIGPCMLPVDTDGRPLMNGVLYGVDTRATDEIRWLDGQIGRDRIFERCGNALTSQSVGPKILWLKRHRPEIFARTARILTATSYLTFRLTGDYVIDHYTAANFSPLYDVDTQDWTTDLTDAIVGPAMLPRLMWSTDMAGTITAQAAAETGLAAGTPVTVGTIDAAAEAVSVQVQAPGDMMMMYGSTIFIIQVTADRVRDPALWYAPWLTPGSHASMAGLATSGTLTHWFRDQFAREVDRDNVFGDLMRDAMATPPGAAGLIALPYFSGERTPIHDPDARGCIFGLNLTHTRAHIYRALLEGIAFGTAHVIETYANANAAPRRILAVGGGTQNDLWMQATSDICGVPQIVCDKTVGAAYGNAFLAACAIGAAQPDDISVWNPVARHATPQSHANYAPQFALFKRLYLATKDIASALGTLS